MSRWLEVVGELERAEGVARAARGLLARSSREADIREQSAVLYSCPTIQHEAAAMDLLEAVVAAHAALLEARRVAGVAAARMAEATGRTR